jgi:hypothetical protein
VISKLLGAVLLALALPAFGQIPAEPAAFTEHIAVLLRKALPAMKLTVVGELAINVAGDDGKEFGKLGLGRVFDFCRANRGDCPRVVDDYVAGMSEIVIEQSKPLDPGSVRLVVRPREYIEQGRRQRGRDGLLARPLVADLYVVPVIDTPRAMRMVDRGSLKELKMQDDEAVFELGRRNLAQALRPLREVIQPQRPGSVGRLGADDYESSRLLLHAEWGELARQMDGKLVVMVPASNLLLYADGGSMQSIDAIRALGREATRRSPRTISETLLRWTPEGWAPVP